MTKILNFDKFLNEKYMETPEHRIKLCFDQLEKNIRHWFEKGTLSTQKAELVDIKRSTLTEIDKNLIFDFLVDDFYYQVYVIISLQDVTEEELTDCYVKVKKYNGDGVLLRRLGKDVPLSELNEDKILELFAELDEKSDSIKDEAPSVLSDEDTDLEDTSIS